MLGWNRCSYRIRWIRWCLRLGIIMKVFLAGLRRHWSDGADAQGVGSLKITVSIPHPHLETSWDILRHWPLKGDFPSFQWWQHSLLWASGPGTLWCWSPTFTNYTNYQHSLDFSKPVLRSGQWDQTYQVSRSVTLRHQALAPLCAFTLWSPCIGHSGHIFLHHDMRLVATHCLWRHSSWMSNLTPLSRRQKKAEHDTATTRPCQTTILRKMGRPGHPNSKQRPAKPTTDVEHNGNQWNITNIGPSGSLGFLKNMMLASLWWRCSSSDRPCKKELSLSLFAERLAICVRLKTTLSVWHLLVERPTMVFTFHLSIWPKWRVCIGPIGNNMQ